VLCVAAAHGTAALMPPRSEPEVALSRTVWALSSDAVVIPMRRRLAAQAAQMSARRPTDAAARAFIDSAAVGIVAPPRILVPPSGDGGGSLGSPSPKAGTPKAQAATLPASSSVHNLAAGERSPARATTPLRAVGSRGAKLNEAATAADGSAASSDAPSGLAIAVAAAVDAVPAMRQLARPEADEVCNVSQGRLCRLHRVRAIVLDCSRVSDIDGTACRQVTVMHAGGGCDERRC
jgi:hypothetical protein